MKEWFEKQTFWQISLGFCGSTFVDWSINYLLDNQEHTAFTNMCQIFVSNLVDLQKQSTKPEISALISLLIDDVRFREYCVNEYFRG